MNATPLALHSGRAVCDTLRSHGWKEGQAAAAAGGIAPAGVHLTGIDPATREALIPVAGRLGLEVLTGEGWAILTGSRSRLSAFARPWLLPAELAAAADHVGRAMPADPAPAWRTARGMVQLDHPILHGILNVTPDSFSDGGRFTGVDAALAHADRLLADGAGMIDVGGESTRPGATPVPADEERRRVIPVITALVARFPELVITVDTVKGEVARAAFESGAAAVNDVSGFRLDPTMPEIVAAAGAGAILMHSRGGVGDMASYEHADYGGDVVGAVIRELRQALDRAAAASIAADALVVDPGLGFSKTPEQNILLLDQLAALGALGCPVLVGPSRKRFLGVIAGAGVDDRDRITAVACALAYGRGARLFRVHDVACAREAVALAHALGGP